MDSFSEMTTLGIKLYFEKITNRRQYFHLQGNICMAVIKFLRRNTNVTLITHHPWFMKIYPTDIHKPFIPKVELTEQNHFWFSIGDTIGVSSAQ